MHNSEPMPQMIKIKCQQAILLLLIVLLSACGGSAPTGTDTQVAAETLAPEPITPDPITIVTPPVTTPIAQPSATDIELSTLITANNLNIEPLLNREIPDITSPLANLGRKLFFSKSLGGGQDTACASCHHPMLAGADQLSLPIGVEAIDSNVLGQGRINDNGIPRVPRNSPTVFNIALWDSGLFWDSRIESITKEPSANGALSAITTPDSGFGIVDVNTGANLVAAQAKFPVTSSAEMKTVDFENNSNNAAIRQHLAARIGDYDEGANELFINFWLAEFQLAFNSTASARQLITFENIAHAIAEYERSMVFIQSPWQNYLDGDLTALTESEKLGALLFFQLPADGGAGCSACHSGTLFSDEMHHTVAFPQIGTGIGAGENIDDDIGRGAITGLEQQNYQFRTPSLLNIAQTAPYGHAGTYPTLERVLDHYNNPQRSASNYANNQDWCQLRQFSNIANCQLLYPNAVTNTQAAINQLNQARAAGTSRLAPSNLNNQEMTQLVSFLESLTDPCIEDRVCMSPWIADAITDNPDGNVLVAIDINAEEL